MKKLFILTITLLFLALQSYSQEDLLDILDEEVEEEIEYIAYTFKATRVINGHSNERMRAKQLDFRINHRFGQLNTGAYELWGLDNALINFSFEYGINDRLMVGLRRGTNKKVYDGSLKFTLIRQSKGIRITPVSVSYYVNSSLKTQRDYLDLPDLKASTFTEYMHRSAYTHQLLIARKFNEQLSLLVSPTFVHRNYVAPTQNNDIIALGFSGRYKFIRRVAFTFEYFYANHVTSDNIYTHPLALGFDIETGGHVFQLFATNSKPMVEDGFIGETTGSWLDGGVYFGFNMSRVFAITGKSHK
ncbi:MAG: hypothetical protein KAI79_09730 [Bacteroidales bacterium]|nr:hypothetical protein [Bacteroidales bacterium]